MTNRTYADPKGFRRLLEHVRERGISLRVEQGRLFTNGPKGSVTPDILRELQRFKGTVLQVYDDSPLPPDRE